MKEKDKNKFQLLDYWFNNISLKFEKESLPKGAKESAPFKDSLRRTIKKISDDVAVVMLNFVLSAGEQYPVRLEVELCGKFECTNWETDEISKLLIRDNATAILFPYLRHAISDLTTLAGLPPLVLPIANIAQIFKDTK